MREKRVVRVAVIAAAVLAAVLVLAVGGAVAHDQSVPAPPAQPTSADQIQNIDQVKTAIKAYYGDTLTNANDPVPNTIDGGDVKLHTFSPTGAYANEMSGLEADAAKYLDKTAKHFDKKTSGTPAVLFDIDDTTLNTYSYEIYSNFVFNPTTNAAFVNASIFPAVPGMPELASHAAADGYSVFFLTGRNISQFAGTKTNLLNAGYPVVDSQLYLKDVSAPWLAGCGGAACTTTQYKTATRQHIESLGYDIVANFGDQFSDLNGGFADETFKVPNPMYFLP
jgi:hypothetical protein